MKIGVIYPIVKNATIAVIVLAVNTVTGDQDAPFALTHSVTFATISPVNVKFARMDIGAIGVNFCVKAVVQRIVIN